MISIKRPLNIEQDYEIGIISSLQDPLGQARVQISTATLDQMPAENLPWAKAMNNNSQVTTNQGSTMTSPHSFKRGDYVLVYRPTASEQDWIVAGHPGTIGNTGQ